MTTTIEEGELNTELQELYLVNKQWIADLEFLDNELVFLKKLAGGHTDTVVQKQESENLGRIEKSYLDLKADMLDYLHKLQPLITGAVKDFNLDLIEDYTALKQRLSGVLLNCQAVKATVFDNSKPGLKV